MPTTDRPNATPSPPPHTTSTEASRIPGPDENAHLDNVLIAELVTLNAQLARYVLHHVDSDAGRAAPIPVIEELSLAERLATAAAAVCERMRRHQQAQINETKDEK